MKCWVFGVIIFLMLTLVPRGRPSRSLPMSDVAELKPGALPEMTLGCRDPGGLAQYFEVIVLCTG